MAMNRVRRVLLLGLSVCAASVCVAATDTTALDGYLAGLSTWSADFTQTMEDAKNKSAGVKRGKLVIVRPGKFRWESAPEGAGDSAELLIADGKNLWSLDRDLEQATVKPQAEVLLQSSPAMLLAGGAELRSAFNVRANGRSGGLDWVRAQPKDAASDFREALFGFKGTELVRLVIVDKLGQRSTLTFTNVKRNAPVDPALMEFKRTPGLDVIGKEAPP
jgi:outer membrane lipoprotein carrier protein